MAPTNLQIVLQQVRWYWISGTLLVWQFTDNGDDVIGLRYTESRQVAVRWCWYEVRRCSVGGGRANAGDLVVKTTTQIVGVDCSWQWYTSVSHECVDGQPQTTWRLPLRLNLGLPEAFSLPTQKVAVGSTLGIPCSSSSGRCSHVDSCWI